MATAFLCSLVLAATHMFAGRLRFLGAIPRSVWLSGAGGASVAYVFVHLLPELARGQEALVAAGVLGFLEAHVWLVALIGLAVFYGLESLVQRGHDPDEPQGQAVFWLHVALFGLYNAIVGYLLLHRENASTGALLTYTAALALHFVVNDYGLRQNHRRLYHTYGRWVLGAAVVAGTALAAAVRFSEPAVTAMVAFLGGGIILNVMKEELPEDRQSRFLPFAVGAALFAALLLAT